MDVEIDEGYCYMFLKFEFMKWNLTCSVVDTNWCQNGPEMADRVIQRDHDPGW